MTEVNELETEPRSLAPPRSRLCEECGYDLRGLELGGICPECGTVIAPPGTSADIYWRRAVAVGLLLLLWAGLQGTQAVLSQSFSGTFAGVLPALNLPGPKVWVEAMLQLPIGYGPGEPGVSGTRTALLSLFAIWLITLRRPAREGEKDSGLRTAARWVALVPFGASFGVILASQGLYKDALSSYRLLILVFAELPAAAFLYAYLAKLAETVPGQQRRRVFDHLRWAVPATMAIAAVLAAEAWHFEGKALPAALERMLLPAVTVYGIISVLCAMIATVAVGSLAIAFGAVGFGDAIRAVTGARRAIAAGWRFGRGIDQKRARRIVVAIGLFLFVIVAVLGNDQVLWYDTRAGLAGNLPYFNFPGPKVWVAAAVPQLANPYAGREFLSHTTLAVLNLAAIWLMTVRLRDDGGDELFRKIARFLPIVAMGIAIGCAGGWQGGRSEELGAGFRSEYFAGVLLLCEAPATILLYLYAAQVAGSVAQRPRLGTQLVIIAVCIPVLAGLSMLAFSISGTHRDERFNLSSLAACGTAGAIAFVGAAWAVVSLFSLAGTLLFVDGIETPPAVPDESEDQFSGLVLRKEEVVDSAQEL